MPRKSMSFGALYNYINKGANNELNQKSKIFHNVFSRRDEVVNEFTTNASRLKKIKGANYLYHEIISITPSKDIPLYEQIEKLRNIVKQYIQLRCNNCLVYGEVHTENLEKNNLHYHLMISANEVDSTKRLSLKKRKFNNIKKDLEMYVVHNYPELKQGEIINNKSTDKAKKSDKEFQRDKRSNTKSQKEIIRDRVREILKKSKNKEDFYRRLSEARLSLYMRGKNLGVEDRDTGKKYRLESLGLKEEFNKFNEKNKEKLNNIGDKSKKEIEKELEKRREALKRDYAKKAEKAKAKGKDLGR